MVPYPEEASSSNPLVLQGISIAFLITHIAPGSSITFLAGEYRPDPVYIATIKKMFGLEQPIHG